MGLSKSFGSQAQTTVKLGKLHTVPTTEDLLFVLATATQNKKTAELPFRNPNNNANFTVKVAPATTRSAPRWTFERNSESGAVLLWARETNEVIMIQGKIKIESNYTGAFETVQDGIDEQNVSVSQSVIEGASSEEISDRQPSADEQLESGQSATGQYRQQPDSMEQGQTWHEAFEKQEDWQDTVGKVERQPGAEWEQSAQQAADEQEVAEPDLEGTNQAQSKTEGETQKDVYGLEDQQEEDRQEAIEQLEADRDSMIEDLESEEAIQQNSGRKSKSKSKSAQPDSRPAKDAGAEAAALPPPVVLHPAVLPTYLSSLCDPATGLLSHGAFEFFLLRDVEYVQKHGGKMSLLVFDFINPGKNEPPHASTEAASAVAGIITGLCGSLEHCTQLRTGEFAVLLCGYDGKGAVRFADKICSKLFAVANDLKGVIDHKALAIGVACIPENCKDPGTLISAAIKAKGLARESQRRCLQFPSGKRRR